MTVVKGTPTACARQGGGTFGPQSCKRVTITTRKGFVMTYYLCADCLEDVRHQPFVAEVLVESETASA